MYVFMINPVAGKGKGVQVVKHFLRENNVSKKNYKTYYTDYPGHAIELTKQIASLHKDKITMLIVVGGDGTFYEVLNGAKNFNQLPLAFVPVGSGNDFARGCDMPLNPKDCLNQIFKDNSFQPYWAGAYLTDHKPPRLESLFASSLGFGFDAEVAERSNESNWKQWFNRLHLSVLVYVLGLIITIFKFKPKQLTLVVDGQERVLDQIWMLTISNHPYFGGGMKIAPNATINKHTFYVTIVHQISRWKLLLLFMTVFFGQHTKLKEVETFRASHLMINSQEKLTYHADGYTGQCYHCSVHKETTPRFVKRKK